MYGVNQMTWIIISVAFSSFMARMNNYSVNVSLPTISQFFQISPGEASRIITGYLLIITSSLLLFGKLSDRIGLKNVFILGYAIFIVGSLLCGFAHTIQTLILFRFIQGAGAAMLLATSFAIISRFLPSGRTGSAFGVTSMASALGVATGAPLGGLITGYLSWHWVFLINVPVGLLAILVAVKKIPGETPPAASGEKASFDMLGAAMSFLGLILLLYGMNRGKELGWSAPIIVLCFALSALLLFLFVWHEKRCGEPLLDVRLFKNRTFTFALIGSFFAFMLIAGNAFLLPFYFNVVKGLDAKQTGMVLLAYSLVYVFLSPFSGKLSDRVKPSYLCIAAMCSASVCTFTFSQTLGRQGLFCAFLFLVWLGVSYVFFFSPNNNQVMHQAPGGKQGSASGLFTTTTNLANVFGVAIFEAVFSHAVPDLAGKAGNIKQAAAPLESLLSGFSTVYVLGGALCAAAMVCAVVTMRESRTGVKAT